MQRIVSPLLILLVFALGGCNMHLGLSVGGVVIYDGNGYTGGTEPVDPNRYAEDDRVSVRSQGNLVRAGYAFVRWNTDPDGTGTSYAPGDSLTIGENNTTLYAQWEAIPPLVPLVRYRANGLDTEILPDDVYAEVEETIVVAPLSESPGGDVVFLAWNTAVDGSGTAYRPGDVLTVPEGGVTLYAQWAAESETHRVYYDGNGFVSGAVPTDSLRYVDGDAVRVRTEGDLAKPGYAFVGWNTATDGSGDAYAGGSTLTMGLADVTLYAQWAPAYYTSYTITGVVSDAAGRLLEGTTVVILDADGSGTEVVDTTDLVGRYQIPATPHRVVTVAFRDPDYVDRTVEFFSTGSDREYMVRLEYEPRLFYDANGATAGTITNLYVGGYRAGPHGTGTDVTVATVGDLVKMQDGIRVLFTGWNTAADGSGTAYDPGHTFTIGTGDTTLYAQWASTVIGGAGPAGGIVFYDKGAVSDGWRYLEAAPSSTEWSGKAWGGYGTEIGGTGTAIGTGEANTAAIVAVLGAGDYAASLCADLLYGGYDDWFLPSKDELNQLYAQRSAVGGFASGSYWSSSENDSRNAWGQYFGNGDQDYYSKYHSVRVRAVRGF